MKRLSIAIVVGLVATLAGAIPAASADTNPFERGPAPTTAAIASNTGPFATAQVSVAPGNGFNGGVIYYPTDTTAGTFGAIAICPGFTALFRNEEAWMGPRLASYGFVVIGMETNSTTDSADARGTQLLAALDYLTTKSPVASRVDKNRLAVMGHSAGGAGALSAAVKRPSLKATIGLVPGGGSNNLSNVTVPTMIMAGEQDRPGPLRDLYNTVPSTVKKSYVAIKGADHLYFTKPNTIELRSLVPWLKLTLDQDSRYSSLMCPTLADTTSLYGYAATCPLL